MNIKQLLETIKLGVAHGYHPHIGILGALEFYNNDKPYCPLTLAAKLVAGVEVPLRKPREAGGILNMKRVVRIIICADHRAEELDREKDKNLRRAMLKAAGLSE